MKHSHHNPDNDGRSRLSCAPTADCAFKYQLGDWHLGRSCRLRTAEEKAAAADTKDHKVVAAARAVAGKVFGGISAGKEVCVYVCGCVCVMNYKGSCVTHAPFNIKYAIKYARSHTLATQHTAQHVGAFLDRVKTQVTKIQPPSDEDCSFDVRGSVAQRGLVCTPGCEFRFQLGDLSPNHACRREL